jgi:hypothetical protein
MSCGCAGCGRYPEPFQEPPHGKGSDSNAQAEQFASDPLVSPAWVLPHYLLDQHRELSVDRRPAAAGAGRSRASEPAAGASATGCPVSSAGSSARAWAAAGSGRRAPPGQPSPATRPSGRTSDIAAVPHKLAILPAHRIAAGILARSATYTRFGTPTGWWPVLPQRLVLRISGWCRSTGLVLAASRAGGTWPRRRPHVAGPRSAAPHLGPAVRVRPRAGDARTVRDTRPGNRIRNVRAAQSGTRAAAATIHHLRLPTRRRGQRGCGPSGRYSVVPWTI